MKLKHLAIAVLIICLVTSVYAAMTSASFSATAKRGWAWHLTGVQTTAYADFEPQLIQVIEDEGVQYDTQRLNENADRQAKIQKIRESLRGATDAQIAAALTALGL